MDPGIEKKRVHGSFYVFRSGYIPTFPKRHTGPDCPMYGGGPDFFYYRKVLAETKLCKLIILPKEGIENRR